MTLAERLAHRRAELETARQAMNAEMGKHQQETARLNALHQAEMKRHGDSVNALANAMKQLEGRVAELEELQDGNHYDCPP